VLPKFLSIGITAFHYVSLLLKTDRSGDTGTVVCSGLVKGARSQPTHANAGALELD